MAMSKIAALARIVPAMGLAAILGGCATGDQYAALDSGQGPCAAQYRAHRDSAPAPANLSREERARYEERRRDYHVSRDCQRAAEAEVTIWSSGPSEPIKPDFSGKRSD
ncbi:hypothetical protein [Pseudoxanthomonas suwonensis]|uniref:hypothetical protein n=1 Tax=Pseudoxanthomonas suwonensis TaxID=314722 RepID=UPI000467E48C|nr:hypothetical protein [Pseudoxanthomonas suwonensis]